MSDVPRFCKFCGEQVVYMPDFNDHFCQYCHSYQTHAESVQVKGKKAPAYQIDSNPPPTIRPTLPPAWQHNIPMFRHREYLVVQAFFSWGAKYTIYNVTGQVMGSIKGKIISWGGEFDFSDFNGNHVAKIKGKPTLVGFQDKTFDIYDHQGAFRGAIKGKYGFLRRKWELYNHQGQLIGLPNEQIWLKTNFQAIDPHGRILVSVDKKWFTFRDQFRVIVSEFIDPLIALAYAVAIDYMYFRKKN
ncbi:MAG: LURP-one-related/scramblase family protein [Candidatus Heimdallarchaeota archaeon]